MKDAVIHLVLQLEYNCSSVIIDEHWHGSVLNFLNVLNLNVLNFNEHKHE